MGRPKSVSRQRRLRLLAAGVPVDLGGLSIGEERWVEARAAQHRAELLQAALALLR